MRRYWIDNYIPHAHFEIQGDTFHHIFEVCRTQEGQSFEVLNGDGSAHLVKAIKLLKKSAIVEWVEARSLAKIKDPKIHLVLSMPRISTFEFILEKMVELGVDQIHPVLSDYSFYQDPRHKALTKVDRWHRIIKAACQQSARAEPLKIQPLSRLEDILKSFNPNASKMGLFAYEGESSMSFQDALQKHTQAELKEIWLFVGSEGGFSAAEVAAFAKIGLQSLNFGEQILRVETACMALVSGIKYQYRL